MRQAPARKACAVLASVTGKIDKGTGMQGWPGTLAVLEWLPSEEPGLRRCRRHLPLLRPRHHKSFISLGRDLVADPTVDADAADIGHEDARLAGDVGAHVPGIGLRK